LHGINNDNMWYLKFRQAFFALLPAWLLSVIVQSAGRAYLLRVHGTPDTLRLFASDVRHMFWTGLLFDVRTATLLLSPWLLLAALLALGSRGFETWKRLWPWLAALASTLLAGLTLVNIFYYATYDRCIDIFIFGLMEDDTTAVLVSLWHDYPVLRASFALAVFALLVWLACRAWQRRLDRHPAHPAGLLLATSASLVIVLLCVLGSRGSLGTFPLRQSDAQVSDQKMLNMLTPNGMMALNWAVSAHSKYNDFDAATDEQGAALLGQFLGRPTAPGLAAFQARTRVNPAAQAHPPNVVLSVMESMGYHLETFDQPGRDLFGALRPHWDTDWRYTRFLSEGDGTIDTLSRLFVRSPKSNISQSSAQALDFASNALKPYLAQGYKVVFVTSGNGAWRNLNQFLPHLGVSEFVEQNTLRKRYPQAPMATWGVPDEYMFRYIEDRLAQAEAHGEHVLIISMSTTHHPPYQTPPGYPEIDITLTDAQRQRLSNLAANHDLREVFNTLRYANDQLGRFISWVKDQPVGAHTIIAATGDHNLRGIGYPDPRELAFGHAVPFYLYVPEAYRAGRHFDPARVGSHKDILPTLYQLSLSDTPYYRTGCDLLAPVLDETWCQGYNPEIAIARDGAYTLNGEGSFLPWADTKGWLLGEPRPLLPEQARQRDRWRAYTELLQWQINRQVHRQQ